MSFLSVGVDEAGRGCVLGPLVVAIVAAEERDRRLFKTWDVRDSKLVTPKRREELATLIKELCWFRVEVAIPAEIDEAVRDRSRTLNGLELERMAALLRAFRSDHADRDTRALVDAPSINANAFREKLHTACDWTGPGTLRAEHHADRDDRTVGAASIIAKSERERLLALIKQELGIDFGSGYPGDERTIAHLKAAPSGAAYVRWTWSTTRRGR